jgi:hypothetical protein
MESKLRFLVLVLAGLAWALAILALAARTASTMDLNLAPVLGDPP